MALIVKSKINQKGRSLIEIMVALSILSILSVLIMKQTDFQLGVDSHMNQKTSADLLTQGIKEILSSKKACSLSLSGISLSGENELDHLLDEKGNILYKISSSDETSGKKEIDELIRIKSIKVKDFIKDKNSDTDGFITLELELEKLSESFGNKVFKKTIDAIRVSGKEEKFKITTASTGSHSGTYGYTKRDLRELTGQKRITYAKGGSISGSFPPELLGINRHSGSPNVYMVLDTYPKFLSLKNKKLKITNITDGSDSITVDLQVHQPNNPESKRKDNVDGYEFRLSEESFFQLDKEYEMEFLTDANKKHYSFSSCQYIGMRIKTKVTSEDRREFTCPEDLNPTLNCDNNPNAVIDHVLPEKRNSIKFSITAKSIHASATGYIGYIEKDLGNLRNNGSSAPGAPSDFFGIYTYGTTSIHFLAERPLFDQIKKIKITKADGRSDEYPFYKIVNPYHGKPLKTKAPLRSAFVADTTYEIELISDDTQVESLFSDFSFSVKYLRTQAFTVESLNQDNNSKNFFGTVGGGKCVCSGSFICKEDPNKAGVGILDKTNIRCMKAKDAAPCEAQQIRHRECIYELWTDLQEGGEKEIYDRKGTYKGTAKVKCDNNKLVFTRPPACATYSCPILYLENSGCLVPASSPYRTGVPNVVQDLTGGSLGLPGQRIKKSQNFVHGSCPHDGTNKTGYFIDLTCQSSGWTGTRRIERGDCCYQSIIDFTSG